MHEPGWSCPLEQVRPGSYVKAFALFQWTLRLLQGLGFVAQHMDVDPLQIDHGRVFAFLQGSLCTATQEAQASDGDTEDDSAPGD